VAPKLSKVALTEQSPTRSKKNVKNCSLRRKHSWEKEQDPPKRTKSLNPNQRDLGKSEETDLSRFSDELAPHGSSPLN
jgi:hypothetical protein